MSLIEITIYFIPATFYPIPGYSRLFKNQSCVYGQRPKGVNEYQLFLRVLFMYMLITAIKKRTDDFRGIEIMSAGWVFSLF